MDTAQIQETMTGTWKGPNLLRLDSDFESDGTASVSLVAKEKFIEFKYTWSHDNTPQEGLLVVGYDEQQHVATAAWIDSWHMSAKVMACEGTMDEKGNIDLLGSYEAPPGPNWGWRIVVSTPAEGTLHLVMYNRSPEGEEELAVRAEYARISA